MPGPANSQAIRVVADVGGTNTRIALYDPAGEELRALTVYRNRDHARFEDVLSRWLDDLPEPAPGLCCLAVAAPPAGDRVVMFNSRWSFSCRELAQQFGFTRLRRLNDFESNAYALPHLEKGDLEELHRGQPDRTGRLATVGPGTGLGGSVLDRTGPEPRGHACEPGHAGLSPASELELELFRALLHRHDNIYAELLVSGPGLARLYRTLGEVRGEATGELAPAEISQRALAGEDPLCELALDTFCALLGSACGDFLLANGAYGGLYLAGGIVPEIMPRLRNSSFHRRMCSKGAMGDILGDVPVYAITGGHPGLLGAAHAPLDQGGQPPETPD